MVNRKGWDWDRGGANESGITSTEEFAAQWQETQRQEAELRPGDVCATCKHVHVWGDDFDPAIRCVGVNADGSDCTCKTWVRS